MRILESGLPGIVPIEPDVFRDGRGYFLETFRKDEYAAAGIDCEFVQDNHSHSARGVLRGLHFQESPGQAKLVRVVRGRIQDVVVDLRRRMPTYGKWQSFELDDERHLQLFVPPGFAHGFCVLSDQADVVYKVGSYYDRGAERGLSWADPDLAIDWQIKEPILSTRDRDNPVLRDIEALLPQW